jgi:hypothetical protein
MAGLAFMAAFFAYWQTSPHRLGQGEPRHDHHDQRSQAADPPVLRIPLRGTRR